MALKISNIFGKDWDEKLIQAIKGVGVEMVSQVPAVKIEVARQVEEKGKNILWILFPFLALAAVWFYLMTIVKKK